VVLPPFFNISDARCSPVAEAREKAFAEACEGYVKESFYRDAEFRAKTAEDATKKAKTELADLNKVLEDKGKELEDVIAEYKGKLESAAEARDAARGAAATLREEVAALKLQHAKDLAAEKEASEGTILAVQAEKTSFEAFVREMSRQILGKCSSLFALRYLAGKAWRRQSPSMASSGRGPVPERGDSMTGASPRAQRVRCGNQSPSVATS
jgi:hypothetical protein